VQLIDDLSHLMLHNSRDEFSTPAQFFNAAQGEFVSKVGDIEKATSFKIHFLSPERK
jgi:hypothetical protein